MKKFICLSICLLAGSANAGLLQFSDRVSFEAQGTIAENYGFEDFGTGFSYPGDPWTAHGVTYNTGNNLIVGTGTSYAPISNVFTYDFWTPVTATIDSSGFDMFALDLGYLGSNTALTFSVSTNLDNYIFSAIIAPLASRSLDFYGFTVGDGEYFTSFNISSGGTGSAPVIDNVTLGDQQKQIPEPSFLALLGFALTGLFFSRKKQAA